MTTDRKNPTIKKTKGQRSSKAKKLGGEIADLHAKQATTSNPDQSRTHEEVDDELHGVSEIGLPTSRTPTPGR